MDLQKLHIFSVVARERSIKGAASFLNYSSAYISKQISLLEDELNQLLFVRQKKVFILSEAGQTLLISAKRTLNEVDNIKNIFNEIPLQESAKKTLTILTTTGFTGMYVINLIKEFCQHYDDYCFKVLTTDEPIDLLKFGADIAISPTRSNEANEKNFKLYQFTTYMYASQNYLDQWGVPASLEDLDQHRLIGFFSGTIATRPDVDWHLSLGRPVDRPRTPYVSTNSSLSHYQAISEGMGIGSLPTQYKWLRDEDLIEIMPNSHCKLIDIYCTFTIDATLQKRITIFLEWLRSSTINL